MKPTTTLLLLLLPFAALSQVPPCLINEVNANAFSFGQAFPADCQYITSWMDDQIDCHGAMNRRPGFFRLTVAQDTTYTVQAGTDGNPADLVWTIWDNCPFQGGNTVASIACGGWDCIEWGSAGFTATITLPAGQYWMWAGMYSDGVTCTEGVVNGSMSIGGECDTPPPPAPAPCPTYTVTTGNTTIEYCGEQTGEEVDIEGFPCGQFDMYVTVQFTTDGTPYPIEVVSDANYVDFPWTPTNVARMAIMDECGGELLWYSGQQSCAFGSEISPPPSPYPSTDYTVMLNLPAGTYMAYIGYLNTTDLPFDTYYEQEGCISYTFGWPTFLDLDSTPPRPASTLPQNVSTPRRYTKVVIDGRGVFIRDGKTGKLYDVVTREVVE